MVRPCSGNSLGETAGNRAAGRESENALWITHAVVGRRVTETAGKMSG